MDTISDLAARWVVRTSSGNLSPEERQELQTWLAADQRHHGAYIRAQAQWTALDRFAALNGPVAESAFQNDPSLVNGTPIASDSDKPEHARQLERTSLTRRRILAASVAATGLLGISIPWLVRRGRTERYVTSIGEVRRIALQDGSTVILNTASEVAVRVTGKIRVITLLRGEALFEVARDMTRPFVVQANGTSTRAVGTAFIVRIRSNRTDVTVTEGVVDVAQSTPRISSNHTAEIVRHVTAGQRLIVGGAAAGVIESVSPAEIQRQLAWRDGMVSFDGESLATAVEEINRHNRRQIRIADPALASRPVVGLFRTTDLDEFADAAAAALQASAAHEREFITLRPLTAPPASSAPVN